MSAQPTELRALQVSSEPAVDRAWHFAKSPNCTVEEHDDIIAAVRLANRVPALLDKIERLEAALDTMIYETTSLSPMEPDGSHWCKISSEALSAARLARNNHD